MNEEKVQELIEMGMDIEVVESFYDVIKDLAEGELKELVDKCFNE